MAAPPAEDLVSVVMPVHNALPHLDGAVRSILDQTHRAFEFIIYDDGSTDGSTERLREWARRDSRIQLFEGKRQLGPVGSSSFVVARSSARYVARMDADDLCSPDRLAREFEALRANPRAGLVGTLFDIIDEQGRLIRGPDYWRLSRHSAFPPFAAHGSIMFRRAVFDEVGGYRAQCEYWEDQDLIVRMAAVADALVIPATLYHVRQWRRPGSTNVESGEIEAAVDLMYRCVSRLEHGSGYDDLLGAAPRPDRIDPRVFVARGSRTLWAGGRPRLLARMIRRGRLRADFRTASALVWTMWAALSPSSLRVFMKLLLRARNLAAVRVAEDAAPLRWSPPVPHADQ